MAKIYLRQIIEGKMSIGDVPARWQSEVEILLTNTGNEEETPGE